MQILIIGAAGMVGRKLTNHLVAKGHLGDRTISRLTLHDVIDPGLVAKASFTVDNFASDFSDPNEADKLLADRPRRDLSPGGHRVRRGRGRRRPGLSGQSNGDMEPV